MKVVMAIEILTTYGTPDPSTALVKPRFLNFDFNTEKLPIM